MVPWASLQFVIEAVPDHTTSCFYIYKSIKYSGRLVLREKLSSCWNTHSFDSKCTTVFRGSKMLCVNQSVHLLSPYNAGYFRKGESLSGIVLSSTLMGFWFEPLLGLCILSLSNTNYTLFNTGSTQEAPKPN